MDTNDAHTDAYYQAGTDVHRRFHGTNTVPPAPAEPTRAMPGTLEKLAVMESRVARGEQVFHPDDARDELSNKGVSSAFTLKGADDTWREKTKKKKETQRIRQLKAKQAAARTLTRATTTA